MIEFAYSQFITLNSRARETAKTRIGIFPKKEGEKVMKRNFEREMESGNQIITAIVHGDMEFRLLMEKANLYGYEIVNVAQSQDLWSFGETKRTVILKKTCSDKKNLMALRELVFPKA